MDKTIFHELLEQFKAPWRHVAFWIYLVVVVIGFGAIDVWVSVFDYSKNHDIYGVSQNVSGFFAALIAASTVDLLTSLVFKNQLSLIFLCFGIIVGGLLLYLVCYLQHGYLGLFLSLIGALISLVIWITANSAEDKWSDSSFLTKMRGADTQHGKSWVNQ